MTPSIREALADAIGRELANARKAWRNEAAMIAADARATIAELRAEVADLKLRIHEQAQTIKDGEQGPPGPPGDRGQDGRDGADGKDGAQGAPGAFPIPRGWASGIHYQGEIVTHAGSTWQASRDTAQAPPHEDWAALALKGADAPVGEVCGLFDPQATYRRFDVVGFDGQEWRAKHDAPGPLPGDGWALSAKRGKPGIKGERGDRGPVGPAGVRLVQLKRDNWHLVAVFSDGTTLRCDDRPLFERYHAEVA